MELDYEGCAGCCIDWREVPSTDSRVGAALEEWTRRAGDVAPDPGLGEAVEGRRDAPATPAWV